jgi:hypothetical protein
VRVTILLSGDPGSFSVDSLRLLLIAYLALQELQQPTGGRLASTLAGGVGLYELFERLGHHN